MKIKYKYEQKIISYLTFYEILKTIKFFHSCFRKNIELKKSLIKYIFNSNLDYNLKKKNYFDSFFLNKEILNNFFVIENIDDLKIILKKYNLQINNYNQIIDKHNYIKYEPSHIDYYIKNYNNNYKPSHMDLKNKIKNIMLHLINYSNKNRKFKYYLSLKMNQTSNTIIDFIKTISDLNGKTVHTRHKFSYIFLYILGGAYFLHYFHFNSSIKREFEYICNMLKMNELSPSWYRCDKDLIYYGLIGPMSLNKYIFQDEKYLNVIIKYIPINKKILSIKNYKFDVVIKNIKLFKNNIDIDHFSKKLNNKEYIEFLKLLAENRITDGNDLILSMLSNKRIRLY